MVKIITARQSQVTTRETSTLKSFTEESFVRRLYKIVYYLIYLGHQNKPENSTILTMVYGIPAIRLPVFSKLLNQAYVFQRTKTGWII